MFFNICAALRKKVTKSQSHIVIFIISFMANPKNTYTKGAMLSAFVVLFSGIVMAYLSFFRSENGTIDESVLWYVSQCFIYAGSFFGIGIYAYGTLEDVKRKLGVKE